MIDLGSLGRSSYARDINNHRDEEACEQGSATWARLTSISVSAGRCPQLGTGTRRGSAFGLNNGTGGDPSAVAVVGSSSVPSGETYAVMWRRVSTEWLIENLGHCRGHTYDVHELRDRPGISPADRRAFRWNPSRVWSLCQARRHTRRCIGNNGDVAGIRYEPGQRHRRR